MNEKEEAAKRIVKISRIAKWVCILVMLFGLSIISQLLWSLFADPVAIEKLIKEELVGKDTPVTLTETSILLAFISSIASIIFGLFIFGKAVGLFSTYMTGNILTLRNASTIQTIGWAVVLLAPITMLSETLAILAATWGGSGDNVNISIKIDDMEIYGIILGLLLVTLGRILQEAAIISDEHKTFI